MRAQLRASWLLLALVSLLATAGYLVAQTRFKVRPRTPGANDQTESTKSGGPALPMPSKLNPASEAAKKTAHDPEEKKRELFANWPKPQVALVLSGNQMGYVEPCGCTGLDNQKGGVMRRRTFLNQLVAKGWEVVPLDTGNQVRRFGKQAEIQFQFMANAMKKMHYRAIGLGPDDLKLSTGDLVAAVNNVEGNSPFLSANVSILARALLPQFNTFEAGGLKIGVTSILGDEYRKRITNGEIETQDPVVALKEVVPKLMKAKCDFNLLMVFASETETKALAPKFKENFDAVLMATPSGEPAFEPETIPGTDMPLIRTGAKGMYMVVLGLFDDEKRPLRYERVPLDARFADAPDMLEMMAGYQDQLQQLGLEDLGLKPLLHPLRRKFAGTKACAECHKKAYEVWEGTGHAHATDSLVKPRERAAIPRHYDPECLSCHVTGWDPQNYYPYVTGYLNLKDTPHMAQNGCENCHGPGAEHIDAENNLGGKFNEATIKKLRDDLRISLKPFKPGEKSPAEQKCLTCHDIDNSPNFHKPGAFEEYWQAVEHIGKD